MANLSDINRDVPCIPAEAIEFTIEAWMIRNRASSYFVYRSLILIILLALSALPLVHVNVTVRSAALVRSVNERIDLRANVSGVVEEVFVADNAELAAGDLILKICTRDIDERIAALKKRKDLLEAKRADVQLIIDVLSPISRELDGSKNTVGPDLAKIREAFRGSGRFKSDWGLQNYFQIEKALQSHVLAENKANIEYMRLQILASRGICTKQQLEDSKYSLDRVRADRAIYLDNTLFLNKETIRNDEISEVEFSSDERRLVALKKDYEIRAPQAGSIVGFSGVAAGSYLSAGQAIAAVSPRGELMLTAVLSPRDVGQLRIGQAASIAVDAFPSSEWGVLAGTVSAISSDLVSTAGGTPAFAVLVKPKSYLLTLKNGATGTIGKGMTAQVSILVGRRSLWSLLKGGMSDWFKPNR